MQPEESEGETTPRLPPELARLIDKLHVRVERLEQQQTAETVTPRFPHNAPVSREEQRAFMRRIGWNKTADLL